jgi:phosphoglycolate phosphatase-like HAD superfamily hydrolase
VIRNIIWDFDGTIVDTYPVMTKTFLVTARERFSVNLDYDDVYALCKVSLTVCFEELARRFETTSDAVRLAFSERYGNRPIGVDEPVFAGVRETMLFIRAAGGRNLLVTHREAPSLAKYGEIGGCRPLLDDIVAGDSGFPLKPDPASFNHIIAKHRLRKSETIGVGDRALDVGSAASAGIVSCYFDPEQLGLARADFTFHDYSDLIAYLRENGRRTPISSCVPSDPGRY